MQTLITLLRQYFLHAITTAFSSIELPDNVVEITPSTQVHFGHYQCNSAMRLAKLLGMPPRAVAEKIVQHLTADESAGSISLIERCEIAGPGFINIHLNPDFLAARIQTILQNERLGIPELAWKEKIIIDFSSPNIAKEMHVGHLRSTIIGDCLARLFEFLGYNVLRLNHVGDWGTAFGMLIAHIKECAQPVLVGRQHADLSQLVHWYRESKQRFDHDPEFKLRSQQEVVALQGGDSRSLEAWSIICDISRQAYQEIYDLLDIRLQERGESFYNPMLANVIAELEAKQLIELSNGAKCIFLPGFANREGEALPLIAQKSDGGYNYATTDLAALRHRVSVEKANRIIYVTDAGQATHFQMIFTASELAGYVNPAHVKLDHVTFGLVLGPDGKKFRTRSGETERLIDLLQAAIEHARTLLSKREINMPKRQLEETAAVLGINAIKYADLSCNRTGDYTFSYERMLRFEGNTAAFLMYAYVRVAGIKRKVGIEITTLKKLKTVIRLEHPTEITLGLRLCQFAEVLDQITYDLLPNRLTDYLYGLAEQFNAFFRDCRVEGDPAQNSRLLLCEVVANTLRTGMTILGLKTVERM